MPHKRGSVVLVHFPQSDGLATKKRPALVVQGDGLDTGLPACIVAQITSNLARMGPTRVMVRMASPNGRSMGLETDSVVVLDHIATVDFASIYKTIGTCQEMPRIDAALKLAVGL